jgi:hypothetical protein
MRKWLRRIRGALGMGFTWAAAWFAVGSVPRWVFGVSTDLPLPLLVRGASLGWGEVLAISTTFALASAVSASGSLALARRAVGRELPDALGRSPLSGAVLASLERKEEPYG